MPELNEHQVYLVVTKLEDSDARTCFSRQLNGMRRRPSMRVDRSGRGQWAFGKANFTGAKRMQSYIYWALLGMVGYSLTTLFTKPAERSGEVSSYMVLAVSSMIVAIFVIAIVG